MALTQEDCIVAHYAEKKRKNPAGPSSVQPPRYRVVSNAPPRAPQRNAPTGRLVFRPPQQQGRYRPPVPPQQSQPSGPRPNVQQVPQRGSNYHCFNCGSADHFIRDCPRPKKSNPGQSSNQGNQNKGKKPIMEVRQRRINFTTLVELPDGAPVMSGTFSIHHKPVVTLFDSGATHSFISNNYGNWIKLDPCPTKGSYMISTPGGSITSNRMIRSVPIQLGSKEIKTDLVLISLEGIDVILGTN
jgi:hypothetical protein